MQTASDRGGDGLMFFAFDLLELDGENVARLPLGERKQSLKALLVDPAPIGPKRRSVCWGQLHNRLARGSRASRRASCIIPPSGSSLQVALWPASGGGDDLQRS